ncbi:MAG: ATP phosphoribosyltransferase regulatory subunit, partial [Akkermansiaceae bacterium]
EFIQFNADILGEGEACADAELIALAIDTMLSLGFMEGDFVIRASDRESWLGFCAENNISEPSEFLPIIDRLEKLKPEAIDDQLATFGVTRAQVDAFIANPENASAAFNAVQDDLNARGLGKYLELDLTIVRGLAYYTGIVFEIFDTKKSMRAVAGGGRYDGLLATLSDGSADLPATGFAMGDMVIRNFIEETPNAKLEMEAWMARNPACDIYLVIADASKRSEALGILSELRTAGFSVDFSMSQINVGKQFKKAEQSGARFALVIGSEFPEMQLKILSSRTEETIHPNTNVVEAIQHHLDSPDGPLLA